MATREKNILGFEISMHHAPRVRVRKCVGELTKETYCLGDGERTFPRESGAQRLSLHVRHYIVEEALGFA
jgi:hypothetical protein